MELTFEQKLEIARMAAQIVMDQINAIQKAHTEVFDALKNTYEKHPELIGRHLELGAIVSRLEQANPKLTTVQLLEIAAGELLRNTN